MNVLVTLGGAGGMLILLTAVITVGRGVFRQVSATEDNTQAIRDLTTAVAELRAQYNRHETRLTVLEDRGAR